MPFDLTKRDAALEAFVEALSRERAALGRQCAAIDRLLEAPTKALADQVDARNAEWSQASAEMVAAGQVLDAANGEIFDQLKAAASACPMLADLVQNPRWPRRPPGGWKN